MVLWDIKVIARIFFNKKGQKIKTVYRPFADEKTAILMCYNQLGNPIKLTAYQDGRLQYWLTMTYYKKADEMIMQTYLPDSSITKRQVFNYNDQGKKIEKRYYDKAGELQIIYQFKYDNKGRRTEKKVHFVNGGQPDFKFLYCYDENGNKRLFKWVSEGELYNKIAYQYNNNGDCVQQQNFNAQNEPESFLTMTYQYDKKGNWIQKNISKNRNSRLLIVRTIVYY